MRTKIPQQKPQEVEADPKRSIKMDWNKFVSAIKVLARREISNRGMERAERGEILKLGLLRIQYIAFERSTQVNYIILTSRADSHYTTFNYDESGRVVFKEKGWASFHRRQWRFVRYSLPGSFVGRRASIEDIREYNGQKGDYVVATGFRLK